MRVAALAFLMIVASGYAQVPAELPDVGFVYLQGLTYEDARQIAEPMLSPGGKLGYLESRSLLIIHDTPSRIEAVREVLAKVDGPMANIRIEVTFSGHEDRTGGGVDVGVNDVRIEHRNGRTRGRGGVTVQGGWQDETTSSFTRQFVTTISGQAAQIWVGRSVPDPVWVREYGVHHGWWRRDVVWRDLGASLVARPRLLPNDLIEVEVYPRITARGPERHSVDVRELSTKVVVRNGGTVSLGGLDTERRNAYRRLIGFGRVFDGEQLTVTLSPTVIGPGRP